tara:strand:- start:188 stop:349 length:162 start_codon:yes stop_codon:yes gene_type:complete
MHIYSCDELRHQAYDLDQPTTARGLYLQYNQHYPKKEEKAMEYLHQGETLESA